MTTAERAGAPSPETHPRTPIDVYRDIIDPVKESPFERLQGLPAPLQQKYLEARQAYFWMHFKKSMRFEKDSSKERKRIGETYFRLQAEVLDAVAAASPTAEDLRKLAEFSFLEEERARVNTLTEACMTSRKANAAFRMKDILARMPRAMKSAVLVGFAFAAAYSADMALTGNQQFSMEDKGTRAPRPRPQQQPSAETTPAAPSAETSVGEHLTVTEAVKERGDDATHMLTRLFENVSPDERDAFFKHHRIRTGPHVQLEQQVAALTFKLNLVSRAPRASGELSRTEHLTSAGRSEVLTDADFHRPTRSANIQYNPSFQPFFSFTPTDDGGGTLMLITSTGVQYLVVDGKMTPYAGPFLENDHE